MIRVEQRTGVRVLRMGFGSANALGPAVGEAIIDALATAEMPTVLTGEGRVFSAGLNLVELDPLGTEEMAAFVERFSVLLVRTLTTRYPLVAAVNGHAVAGGCVLAMACDQRIGTDGPFKIGMNEMAIGLTLPAIVTEILRGKLAPERARDVILGGTLYGPDAALGVGLLDELVDSSDAAIERACEVARSLGASPDQFAAMKGSLVAPITERFQQTRAALDHKFLETWFGDAARNTRRQTIARLQAR